MKDVDVPQVINALHSCPARTRAPHSSAARPHWLLACQSDHPCGRLCLACELQVDFGSPWCSVQRDRLQSGCSASRLARNTPLPYIGRGDRERQSQADQFQRLVPSPTAHPSTAAAAVCKVTCGRHRRTPAFQRKGMYQLTRLGAVHPKQGICSNEGARPAACVRYITRKSPHIGKVPALANSLDRAPVIGSTTDQETKDASALTPA